ncbi:MAG: hypothetical protein ACRERD_02860 [Candidatus Binatia bacterium]
MKKRLFLVTILSFLFTGVLATPTFALRFQFALIGDLGYNATEVNVTIPNLIADINSNPVEFTIHDGDFKSGASPCTDAVFQQRFDTFQTFRRPFVFIFGDNEWTDCHRTGGDPLERLAKLRELFTQGNTSLGQRTLRLNRQSDDPQFSTFRENVLWTVKDIVFVGLHVVGSNNNAPLHLANGTVVGNQQEYEERNVANLAWMRDAFALARNTNARGIMLIIQANPYDEVPTDPTDLNGFADFLALLQEETIAFVKPVVLVHGDSHYFRIDKPMRINGFAVENFTRVETFGTPDVHWLRATVDSSDPNLFSFKQEIVDANIVDRVP